MSGDLMTCDDCGHRFDEFDADKSESGASDMCPRCGSMDLTLHEGEALVTDAMLERVEKMLLDREAKQEKALMQRSGTKAHELQRAIPTARDVGVGGVTEHASQERLDRIERFLDAAVPTWRVVADGRCEAIHNGIHRCDKSAGHDGWHEVALGEGVVSSWSTVDV